MVKISLYIEKKDFDAFFIWINRLNQGILETPTVVYSTKPEGFNSSLELQLEPDAYNLLRDAESDLQYMKDTYGDLEISFEHQSGLRDINTIKNILRNARLYDMEDKVVYTALQAMVEVPGILPVEAMIISEREWLQSTDSDEFGDI